MKRVFLLIVVPALLLALGFAQTPAASSNTDQINVKGCLGGSNDNYTVVEDNSGKIFKITTSSADLKAHLGQDVNLIGHKAGAAENSLDVTEVNMISQQCTAAAAAPAASVSTPSETVPGPPAAAPAPAPPATVSAPSETVPGPPAAAAPAATVGPSSETASIPGAIAAAPAPAPDAPAETASAPAAAATVHRTQPSARPRKSASNPAAAAATAEPVSTPVADAAVPSAPVGPSSETASTPAVPAAAPTRAPTSRSAGMLVSIVVMVLLIGAGVPLYNRWRRRKLLDQTRGQNLSFTKEAKSDPGESDTTGGRKAA